MTGELLWGIRRSLLDYVAAIPDGLMTFDGRPVAPGDLLSFPLAYSIGWGPSGGTLRFTGEFRSAGHFGTRLAVIADPWIDVDGQTGTVSVRRWDGRPDRLGLAVFAWPGGAGEWVVTPELTPLGTEVFGGVYAAGTALDPVTIRLR